MSYQLKLMKGRNDMNVIPRALNPCDFNVVPPSSICGICQEYGAKRYWPNGLSDYVHASCYKVILKSQVDIINFIEKKFQDESLRQEAQRTAATAVAYKCFGYTLEEYMLMYDSVAMSHLFNTVGIEAVNNLM